ncbi:MAG TPA: DEAD/DEAH box helicase [Solirubrobacteraceae bacterium]|nr:DEAD/DEAH box helicase [Solirubrobacteraceae bacterium]
MSATRTTAAWWRGLDRAALAGEFDVQSLKRGATYARGRRVLSLSFDENTGMLTAHVVGNGRIYETTVGRDEHGYDCLCTCPVTYDCKHVVAVLLAAGAGQLEHGAAAAARNVRSDRRPVAPERARAGITAAPPARVAPDSPRERPRDETPEWERRLLTLIADHQPAQNEIPLALELKLTEPAFGTGPDPRLSARLMRPGARGGWVNGSLSWNNLDGWALRDRGFREEHLTLLREIYAIHQMRGSGHSMSYWSRSPDRSLDLTGCESPQLWPLLAEAERRGISLVHASRTLGSIAPVETGEMVFDIVRDPDGGATARAALRRAQEGDGPELVPLALIGQPAHGVVYTPREDLALAMDRRRIRLVQLKKPISAALAGLLREGRLQVPAAEVDRLRRIAPSLGRLAPLHSHDDSFSAPQVQGPELVLAVIHGPGAHVQLDWEWRYTVDDTVLAPRLPAGGDHAGVRDPGAEQERRLSVTLIEPLLAGAGLIDEDGHPTPAPPAEFGDAGAIEVATELLPRLAGRGDITLRVLGEPPDYRDVGESLQIEVSTSEIAGERDWFDLGLTLTVEGREVPFVEVFRALAHNQSHMFLEDGAHFALTDPRLQTLRELIEEARELSDMSSGPLRISRFQAGLWEELTDIAVAAEQAARWREQVARLGDLDRLTSREPPAGLTAALRPYQRDGVAWLATLWELGLGGILADDMGLGKTVQALALILHAKEREPQTGPFLVVAPTSVATNWGDEAARFTPSLSVDVVLDTLAKSGRRIEKVATADVVVTTYTLLRLDSESYARIEWGGVILDEAQFVKNHRAKTHRCLRELQRPFTLAITGTPMENNLSELWALLALTAPGLFPDVSWFTTEYAKPIERDHDAERLARLRRRIRPLLMRRTKELVAADLPPKHEQMVKVPLHPRHRKLYDTHLQRERQRVLALLDDYENNRIAIFRSLTRLRQLSLHPALVDAQHAAVPCAKLDALLSHLGELAEAGHRALVFSQFTSFLALVRERLDGADIAHCYLDGATRRRAQTIERFRAGDDPVFLISLKAGGVGLNLTEADYCFLLDPWWNPAVEAQAIGRAHRIGQTSQVIAYRLISDGTIEEKVRALAESKAALFNGVMDEGEMFSAAVTAQDIRGLLA